MPRPKEERYTFADILSWDTDDRIELIDGVPYMMAPPSTSHQLVLSELHKQLAVFLIGKPCRVFPAPFGVRLFGQNSETPDEDAVVLEPDLSVICDRNKLDEHGCKGAPDLVIEILSPSTQRRDRFEKYNLYQTAGVREYWIVDPDKKILQAMVLENGRYPAAQVYTLKDKVPVSVLEGCVVDLSPVFEEY